MIKNICLFVASLLVFCVTASPALSQEKRVITLKDGTKIVGEILSFENNAYTVQSSLGQLQIKDQDIVAISLPGLPETAGTVASENSNPINPTDSQIDSLQQKLLNDESFMADANKIGKNPEIMNILSQPDIMQAIANRDINALQSNPKFKELLNNPQILELIQSTVKKIQPGESSQ